MGHQDPGGLGDRRVQALSLKDSYLPGQRGEPLAGVALQKPLLPLFCRQDLGEVVGLPRFGLPATEHRDDLQLDGDVVGGLTAGREAEPDGRVVRLHLGQHPARRHHRRVHIGGLAERDGGTRRATQEKGAVGLLQRRHLRRSQGRHPAQQVVPGTVERQLRRPGAAPPQRAGSVCGGSKIPLVRVAEQGGQQPVRPLAKAGEPVKADAPTTHGLPCSGRSSYTTAVRKTSTTPRMNSTGA